MIALQNVTKTFAEQQQFEVLRTISLEITKGQFVCVVGPSGAGKSVLLALLAGFLQPTSGTLTMHGQPIIAPDISRIMMFQNYMLFPWKTVYQNVYFGLIASPLTRTQKDHQVKQQLAVVGLEEFADWYTHKLSGGMQQRVALARALITDPEVLLMDEPFAALDSQYRSFLRSTLLQIWERTKKTIVFVTHSVHEALQLADVIYLLTARPAEIKQSFPVALSRPRRQDDPSYVAIHQAIELALADEFQKTINQHPYEITVRDFVQAS